MNLEQIKTAVRKGETVHWANESYVVVAGQRNDDWLITCKTNNHSIGLTHADGETLNGDELDFFSSVVSTPVTNVDEAMKLIQWLVEHNMLFHFEDDATQIIGFSEIVGTHLNQRTNEMYLSLIHI